MKYLKGLLWLVTAWNVWVFSRFTVDDAFITWRYGYNLIHHGVWNYNPTSFDPTQAYTNPLFAVIGIVPAVLGIDVVLFFKIFALLTSAGFIVWFIRVRKESQLWLAIFFMIPATIIHIFSGLETFTFVMFLFLVLVAVVEHRVKLAIWATALLFLTRPEGWLFLALTPLSLAYYERKFHWKELFKVAAILGTVLAAYFGIHYLLFGELLPNTFFVKTNFEFHYWVLESIPVILILLIPLWLIGMKKVSALAAAFGIPAMVIYSTSQLGMDYASRYAFHVYAPFALLVIYVFSEHQNRVKLIDRLKLTHHYLSKSIVYGMVGLISIGFLIPTSMQDQYPVPTYYPRLLDSQGQVGQLVKSLALEGSVKATAISDAGLAPYLADVPNLDPLRLTSRLASKNGYTKEIFDKYQVDFVAVTETLNLLVDVYPILQSEKFIHVCNVYFASDYQTQIWTRTPNPKINAICRYSKRSNNEDLAAILFSDITTPPWDYWHV